MMAARGRVRAVRGRTRVAIADGWELAQAPAGAFEDPRELAAADLRWIPARVPGTVAGALRAGGIELAARPLDEVDWWWRVRLAEPLTGVLGFDGVATCWDAWLDGEWVAHGDSMHEARAIDVLAPARELVLRCAALPARRAGDPPPRRRRSSAWPAIGPWRAVWRQLPGAPDVGVVSIDARLEGGAGFVTVGARLPADVDRASLIVTRGGERVTHVLERALGAWTGCAVVPEPALWWPHGLGEPARYAVTIEYAGGAHGGGAIELGDTGFRRIEVEPGDRGHALALRVNGRALEVAPARWTPLDPVTLAAPREAYDAAVRELAAAGTSLVRVAGTGCYEDDALYDALDAHGHLLWQDLMLDDGTVPGDDAFLHQMAAEIEQECARLAARPALALVCGRCAGDGAPPLPPRLAQMLGERVRALLPGVPYLAAAP